MMNRYALMIVIGAASIGAASAQQTPATPNVPANPTVTMPAPSITAPVVPPSAVTAPVPGANSFTENQAKTRLEGQGFTAVNGLVKDKDGIWRGMGTKSGRSVNVSVDYQGNIVEK
jgi:hypothetical protein